MAEQTLWFPPELVLHQESKPQTRGLKDVCAQIHYLETGAERAQPWLYGSLRSSLKGTCWHMLKVTKVSQQETKPSPPRITNRLIARTGRKLYPQIMSDLPVAFPSMPQVWRWQKSDLAASETVRSASHNATARSLTCCRAQALACQLQNCLHAALVPELWNLIFSSSICTLTELPRNGLFEPGNRNETKTQQLLGKAF